jgi:hypothetical protein
VTRRALVDVLVGLALFAAGGAGLVWHVQSAEAVAAIQAGADSAQLSALLCPLAPALGP